MLQTADHQAADCGVVLPRGKAQINHAALFRLPVDILRPIVGSRILRQQRLGPVGLLLRDFLLAGRETLFGQRQGRHAHLIVPSVGGRQQAPSHSFLVLGA